MCVLSLLALVPASVPACLPALPSPCPLLTTLHTQTSNNTKQMMGKTSCREKR
ncbi:hypothetical protein PR003_g9639 [Phytophthora rubi]|uniref:RxLR effector protein n=1 Tax=Phytophthora rubi TaxID=129364 RepID=A0A6A4FRP7_9STRA|nr:hypothetical protein PR001_g8860 [Phytophthora rubi]KAE9046662.1 hypothetical protein PR002_g1533 [Phytophthora rubi]KAE9342118.1 hypothetical protein PR003_g9639 [Phytophthora rubi]